ncbi:MAG: HEAT repeat domain-containing protein [Deltaproteobacteria bacterium]|jgi:hypothetical protein|nr:HEAT repeat domain-containing protein [Deltaproteobacteria bacterium]
MTALPEESAQPSPDAPPFAGAEPFAAAIAAQPAARAKERLSEAGAELRGGLHQFVVAMKNLALYPETSQTNVMGMRQLREWFASYISNRGPIVLEVGKDGLSNQDGEPVYQEKASEANLAFPLFRDGVQSIFFEEGLTEEELKAFIHILLRFRTTNESAQDDVVTSMWDAGFQFIKYAVADEYEEVDSEFDLGAMVCARPPSTGGTGPVRIDPDAPQAADAPVQTDGAAPIAKSLGSLFALADSLDFSFAPGGPDGRVEDPPAGGKTAAPPPGAGTGGGGGGGPVTYVRGPGGAEADDDGEDDFGGDDDDDDGWGDDGGFGPMGGAAGPKAAPPPGAGGSDGGFYRDESGRVKRGRAPGGNGAGKAAGGDGADPGQADPKPENGGAGADGTGGSDTAAGGSGAGADGSGAGADGGPPSYQGSGVGAPRRGHGPKGGDDGEGSAGDEDDGFYGSQGSVYDPDGDPDGHPVKGPADAASEPGDPDSEGESAFGNALQNLDLSSLNTDDFDERTEMSQPVTLADEEDERPEIDEKTLESRAQRLKFWGLSSREIKQVSALIQWDEARAKSASILDLVMVLVKSPVLRPSMLPSLTAFLAEELRQSCSKTSLAHVNAFLARLQDLAAKSGWEGPQARLRQELQKVIADPGLLEILSQSVADDDVCAANFDSLRYFLYQLPQGSAMSLAAAMPAAKSLSFKKLMVEVICWQLPSVLDQFGKIALALNEWSLLELLGMLSAMRKPMASPVKVALLKHPSPEVRIRAARLILDVEPDTVTSVSHLIVDPDSKVRAQIAPFIMRRRDPHVEGVLRKYLSDRYAQKLDGPDLIEHYRRLGRVAGRGSLPFLAEVLTKKDLGSLFGASADFHRTGAALALMLMPESTGAGEIVKKASRSAFRAVRSASAEAARLYARGAGGAE